VDLRTRAAQAEAVLFVAGEPLSIGEIARALECTSDEAEDALSALQTRLDESGSSLQILSIAGGYQLSTRPAYAEVIGRLLTRETGKLSRAALETLAIIAYRQPITQPEIEAVRGVGCTSVLRTLVERNLIAEAGRKPTVGRPILYATTPSFLHYFALKDLSELPPLEPQEIGSEDAAVTE
jgi:segregation and condensation protein B